MEEDPMEPMGRLFSLRRYYPVQVIRVSSQPSNESTPEIQAVLKRTKCKTKAKSQSCPIIFIFLTTSVTKQRTRPYHIKSIAMKLFLIIFSSLLGFSAMAQQNAMLEDPSVKSRTINGSFNAIQVSDGISLYLSAGKEESVAVRFF
jgi:hypothetical protein